MTEVYWLKRHIQEKKLTTAMAAAQCGVSIETMQIVLSGRPTLPCLALQIGSGLGLTQEQVKLLDNLWRIERGDTLSLNKARRWADALGVELKEIGEKCIKIY